jgi:hypothetical protein
MKARRPVWLWMFSLWALGLGIIGVWRGIVLWGERRVLYERESSLSPAALTLFVALFGLCGLCLIASAVGMWLRRNWARHMARIWVPAYLIVAQAYVWRFVRSGLMWKRRWVSSAGAILGIGIWIGALTWARSRKWLGLR